MKYPINLYRYHTIKNLREQLMINRLFVSDLDKTLLRSDMSISTFTKDTWNDLVDKDIKLTIATARSGVKTLDLLNDLKLSYPMIVMDGSMIISCEGDTLLSNSLSSAEVLSLLDVSNPCGINPFIIGSDESGIERFRYSFNINALQKELISDYKVDKRMQQVDNLTPLKENVKIVYIGEKDPIMELENKFREKFGDMFEIKCQKDVYLDGYFLTILHPKGDKAHALESLTDMIGVSHSQLTVFGDSSNDIGMFGVAGEKIAVNNALDELKDIATHTLPHSNDEDAVARYLRKIAKF
jgi:Cof subfamily protein (haloacid dehalogenase superfamily)